jgi:hypothetical protein
MREAECPASGQQFHLIKLEICGTDLDRRKRQERQSVFQGIIYFLLLGNEQKSRILLMLLRSRSEMV